MWRHLLGDVDLLTLLATLMVWQRVRRPSQRLHPGSPLIDFLQQLGSHIRQQSGSHSRQPSHVRQQLVSHRRQPSHTRKQV